METRAKNKLKQGTIFEEIKTLASSAAVLLPSQVAKARRDSGMAMAKKHTPVAPKQWPTVYTLKQREEQRAKLAKSPAALDTSTAGLAPNVAKELKKGADAKPQALATAIPPPPPPLPQAGVAGDVTATAGATEILLKDALSKVDLLTRQNSMLEQALDASFARQDAMLQRQQDLDQRSQLSAQRTRNWVTSSNASLRNHGYKYYPDSEAGIVIDPTRANNGTLVPANYGAPERPIAPQGQVNNATSVHVDISAPDRTIVQREQSTAATSRDFKILKYSGDSYVDTYLTQFQLTARAAGYPRSEWGYRLCAALEGKARGILTQDVLDGDLSYEVIAAMLRRRFASESSPELWQQQLEGRRRGQKETIAELQHGIRDAMLKAFPEVDIATRSRLASGYFINALGDSDQRRYVRTLAPKTLEEAARVALAYENAQRIDEQRSATNSTLRAGRQVRAVDEPHELPQGRGRGRARGGPRGGAAHTADDVAEGAENSSLVREVGEMVAAWNRSSYYPSTRGNARGQGRGAGGRGRGRGRGAAPVRPPTPVVASTGTVRPRSGPRGSCFTCGEQGHYARDCPNAAQIPQTCFRCGQTGHLARFCQSDRENEDGSGPAEQALSHDLR